MKILFHKNSQETLTMSLLMEYATDIVIEPSSLTSSLGEISPATSDHPTSEKATESGIVRVVRSILFFYKSKLNLLWVVRTAQAEP